MIETKFITLQEHRFRNNPCLWYLFFVGILEFLLMACGISVYYEHKNYLIFPVFMFFGASFTQKLTASAKRKLLLGILAAIWFLVIQKHRNDMGWKLYPFSWFPAVYLMAYPFASVVRDGEEVSGLKVYSGCFLLAAAALVGYGILLLLDKVPMEYASYIYFIEGSRCNLIWNPNILGCIFMIAVTLCLVFCDYFQTPWIKRLYFAFGIILFSSLALTNSRTVILICCVVTGGMVFFYFFKRNWKHFILAMLAACVVISGSFFISEKIYSFHCARLIAKYTQKIEENAEPTAAVSDTLAGIQREKTVTKNLFAITDFPSSINDFSENISLSAPCSIMSADEANSQIKIIKDFKEDRTFLNHLGTLHGRTPVWRGALRAIREDPSILRWGCEHAGDTISLYTELPYMHSHNSWVEITLSLGLPGAIIAVVYTWIALWNSMVLLWNQTVPLWKKTIALLVLGLLAAGFMEPYLFFSNQFFHFIDFTFFLCLGYVRVWAEALPRKYDVNKFPFCLL